MQYLDYNDIRDHVREEHKVLEESIIPTAIIPPSSLLKYVCMMCHSTKLWSSEEQVIQHISQIHGQFFATERQRARWCKAACRFCGESGDLSDIIQHIESHPTEMFAIENDEDTHGSQKVVTEDIKPTLGNTSTSSTGKLSIRKDLLESDAEHKVTVKTEPGEVSPPEIECIYEKPSSSNSGTKMRRSSSSISGRDGCPTKSKFKSSSGQKKKRRRSPSSSSSSSSSSDSRSRSTQKGKGKAKNRKLMSSSSSSSSSSDSSISRSRSIEHKKKGKGKERSPAHQSVSKSPGRNSKRQDSKERQSRSPNERYSRSPSPLRRFSRSPKRRYPSARSKSPRRYSPMRKFSRSPRRRYSPSRRPYKRSYSKSPKRRYSRSPSRRYSPSRKFSRSPQRTFSPRRQSRSPRRKSPLRGSYKQFKENLRISKTKNTAGGSIKLEENDEYTRYLNGEYECKICNVVSIGRVQFAGHKKESRHIWASSQEAPRDPKDQKEAMKMATNKPDKIDLNKEPYRNPDPPEVVKPQFGKKFCTFCKKAFDEQHYFCKPCNVHCNKKDQFDQHRSGKNHKKKTGDKDPQKFSKSKSPQQPTEKDKDNFVPDSDSASVSSQNNEAQNQGYSCHACTETFSHPQNLKQHIRGIHGYLIKCKQCVSMNHYPAEEVLTCRELITHFDKDHNEKIKSYDLKFYGQVNNWKQGVIRCKLCEPKLGGKGLWMTNELDRGKIRAHFNIHHSSFVLKWMDHIFLQCQLCSYEVPTDRVQMWTAHLHTAHISEEDKTTSSTSSESFKANPGGVVTSPCNYCGENVIKSGSAEQQHIANNHAMLAFTCKLCPGDKYFYHRFEDVKTHLRVHHFGLNIDHDSNINFPGNKKNLLGFSWVRCKRCDFSGIGLGKEIILHQNKEHKGGGLEHFMIYCRLCHKDFETCKSVTPFDDPVEFETHMKTHHPMIVQALPAYRN